MGRRVGSRRSSLGSTVRPALFFDLGLARPANLWNFAGVAAVDKPAPRRDHRPVMPAPRHATRTARLSALVAALACVVTQLAAFAHFALVRHATCPQHGELIHVEADAAAVRPSPHLAPEPGQDAAALHAGDAADAHDHDHCVVAVTGREKVLQPFVYLQTSPSMHRVVASPRGPPVVLAHVAVALLSVAPKNSPPAA